MQPFIVVFRNIIIKQAIEKGDPPEPSVLNATSVLNESGWTVCFCKTEKNIMNDGRLKIKIFKFIKHH